MKPAYYYILLFSSILFVGQLINGTPLNIAFLFSTAIVFGLCAVQATGKWNSMLGLLNLVIIIKYLLFGIILKIFFFQPSDSPLLAPMETSMVAALGFAGVLIGTMIQQKLPLPKTRLIYPIHDKNFYLVLYIFSMTVGYGSWLYFFFSRHDVWTTGLDLTTTVGGLYGIINAFGMFKDLSVVAAVYYAWLSKSKRLITHPLVLFPLVLSTLLGFYSTSKQGMIEPSVYLFLAILSVKGIRYKPLWGMLSFGIFIYVNLIYPFGNYIRYAGGREGSIDERIAVMSEVLPKMILEQEYRESVNMSLDKSHIHKHEPYLPVAGYSFGRFAMIAEADKLIAASTNSEGTGWETITWGFKMALPRFILPDKPILAANNYLARLVGGLGANDYTTQVSYGFMANFYNAFGFIGVIIGSLLLICGLYYWLTLFFGNPANISIWVILVFGQYHHLLAEQSVSGIIASLPFPLVVLIPFTLAKKISKMLY